MHILFIYIKINCRHHYKDYCELLFKTYGDRVKHWTTFNEPTATPILHMHGIDNDAAERCQDTGKCSEAYTILHNYLICHAAAVKLYRQKFQVCFIYHVLKI